ncbi:MAG TPA: hypothetical protein VKP61_15125 [Candidatus Acidoferrum sp.]|nr:hypothetical protein [Candidatus Acidoferrum sp.]
MRKRKFFPAGLFSTLVVFLFPATTAAQTPDLILNPGSSYVDAARSVPWGSSFNRNYVLVPQSPNASVCIYVVNNNPTNAHSFTLAVSQAADPRVADYSNNVGRYQTVPIVGTISPVSASSMASAFVQSTAAAHIAIRFSGSSTAAGSPDTADVFLVQTVAGSCGSASSALAVQGTTTVGAAVIGNPVLIGGQDQLGNAVMANFGNTTGAVNNKNGLLIGSPGISPGASFSNLATINGTNSALAVAPAYQTSAGGSYITPQVTEDGTGSNNCVTNQACVAQWTHDQGYAKLINFSGQTSSTVFTLWGDSSLTGASFSSCRVDAIVSAASGTTPTLDVFLQDSPNGVNWTDRIHFAQFTTVLSSFFAGISGTSTGITPTGFSDGTLAAATKVDGPIDQYGRFKLVITGTTPSYNGTLEVACK